MNTPAHVAVRWVDNRVCVVLSGDTLAELAALLEQAHTQRLRRHLPPIPSVTAAVQAMRHAWAAHTLTAAVPLAEQRLSLGPPDTGRWITTRQAAEHLGISERAIRQRITRGQLPAQRHGRDYLINPLDLETAA